MCAYECIYVYVCLSFSRTDAEEQDPLPALPGDPDTTTSQPPTTTATVTWQVATGQPYLPTPSTSAADTIASEALYTSSVRETLRLGLQDEGAGIREAPVYSRAAGPGFLAGTVMAFVVLISTATSCTDSC